jgi:hypothetical protein
VARRAVSLLRVAALEKDLARVTEELDATTWKLRAAERQIADLKGLIEVRKRGVPKDTPEISD